MPRNVKRNAVFVVGLAALFYWSFMFAKHDPAFRGVVPFGEDPYDAVGSFGAVVGMLIALVSLVRAFRPYHERLPSAAQCVYLVRAQAAVVLAVLITLAADAVAMARHPIMWAGAASRNLLIALLAGLTAVAVSVHVVIRASQQTPRKLAPIVGCALRSPLFSPYSSLRSTQSNLSIARPPISSPLSWARSCFSRPCGRC